ncbi:sigma-E processing peptidase SpoIIGA [Alkalihalobacillus trypoxylicola]|uniref:Sporulation sigma-E factor-processing peptidase n=1 Tax=Alkalihalobacillus trypoxylicola TaxID=519424 RepID=A0A161QB85_9BACI|nr:sigma-E processing peptidase SpoIIGA [Alkalihalobacillus trypoxylicola]KYG35167.1 sigma-E processing peptidase SpoIIGA [Alkalihalobacillus trypoxylicola]
MTVYLDLIWLLNFGIDYLLIALTAIVLKRKFRHIRFLLATFFASLIVFAMFTSFASIVYQPWFKGLFSILIVWIAFGYQRLRFFMQNLAMFYFVTFMTGGGLFALHYFWQTELDILSIFAPENGVFIGSQFSWFFVLIGFPLVWYFSKQRFETIETKKIQAEQIVEIRIVISDKELNVKGLIDTGNQLVDPITKSPVMILETSQLKQVYSSEMVDELLKVVDGHETTLAEKEGIAHRVRIIPYRVIGQSNPFLVAIKPDMVEIMNHGEVFQNEKVLIGLQDGELSADGLFTSIIHPKLVINPTVEKLA